MADEIDKSTQSLFTRDEELYREYVELAEISAMSWRKNCEDSPNLAFLPMTMVFVPGLSDGRLG